MNSRIENLLSRVVSLEERLNSRPSDVADQRRREELIRYVIVLLYSRAHFLLASSISSGGNYGCWLRSRGYLSSLIMFKTMTTCSGLSTISRRRSSTIRSVHNLRPGTLSTLTRTADGATESDSQPGARTDSESLHSRLSTRNDLFAGSRLEHLLALAFPMTIA